jgi:hypothetical protein
MTPSDDFRQERFPIAGNDGIEKELLNFEQSLAFSARHRPISCSSAILSICGVGWDEGANPKAPAPEYY